MSDTLIKENNPLKDPECVSCDSPISLPTILSSEVAAPTDSTLQTDLGPSAEQHDLSR